MGNSTIDKTQLDALLVGLQKRGKDASGVALQSDDGSIHIHKSALQASQFVQSDGYKEFLAEFLIDKVIAALVHTRHMTVGHWSKNSNNHPLEGDSVAVVHNGTISNYKELFKQMSYEAKCETDSDIIRAIIDVHGLSRKCVRELEKVRGSAAIIVLDKRNPGQLLLARSGNPLEVALTDHFLYGASIQQPIFIANKTWRKKWGFYANANSSKIEWAPMPVDTAWLIDRTAPEGGEEGLQWHQEFKMLWGWGGSRYWSDWGDDRQEEHQRICNCGHIWAAHSDKGKCWVSSCHCTAFAEKAAATINSNSTGVEYICPHCKNVCYVPKNLEYLKDDPSKLTCANSECEKTMEGAERVVRREAAPVRTI